MSTNGGLCIISVELFSSRGEIYIRLMFLGLCEIYCRVMFLGLGTAEIFFSVMFLSLCPWPEKRQLGWNGSKKAPFEEPERFISLLTFFGGARWRDLENLVAWRPCIFHANLAEIVKIYFRGKVTFLLTPCRKKRIILASVTNAIGRYTAPPGATLDTFHVFYKVRC